MADDGCRSFQAQSVWNLMTKVGLRGHMKKAAISRLEKAAGRTSCWFRHKIEDKLQAWRRGAVPWPVTADLPTGG